MALDTFLNPDVARQHGVYPAILYAYLQREIRQYLTLNDAANTRLGLKWIPGLSYETIQRDLPVFPDVKTVRKAANDLVVAGLILIESTGAFLAENLKTNRKRDIASWWHVSWDYVARANVPVSYFLESKLIGFDSEEAREHGVSAALVLSNWRTEPVALEQEGWVYKAISAVELGKKLSMDERTARRQLKNLMAGGVLLQHPKRKKLYALAKG